MVPPHDPTVVQLGQTNSSAKEIDNREGSIAAGLAVYLHDPATINTVASGGALLGVSVGVDGSGAGRTAIARDGLEVPIKLTNGFTPTIGTQVQISTTTGKAVTSGTAVNAVYVSGSLTGIEEDGTTYADGVALIDMQGGL